MSLTRKKPGDVWLIRFKHRGQRVTKSTGETDRRKAEAAGRQARAKYEAEYGQGGRRLFVSVSELGGEDVERALAAGASPETQIKTLDWIWAALIRHLGDVDVNKVTYDAVLDYVGRRREEGARGQTIRREVQALKRGINIAERRGWVPTTHRQWPKIKSDPPDPKQRGKLVHPDSIRLVLGELDEDARDEVMFIALTGLRFAETKRVEASWVEPMPEGSAVPAVLRIPAASAKTRRERIVGLSREAVDLLARRAAKSDGLLFSQENHKKALRDACKRAGVPRFHLRDLRHTYATLALQRTGDAVAVQAALGHTDLRTTQRYLSSTVARTVSAGASVSEALGLGREGPPLGSHLGAKNLTGARSSCGQSTGLLSASHTLLACECCAESCGREHGISHTCGDRGPPKGATSFDLAATIQRARFSFAAAGGAT